MTTEAYQRHATIQSPGSPHADRPRIAILIPCYNESISIGQTIAGFRRALPESDIVVCDNASTDGTADIARSHGARVLSERRRGKGWAIRRLFAEVDADIYLMADGDATYAPDDAVTMIRTLVEDGHDMVVGHRLKSDEDGTFRRGHVLGNRMFAAVAKLIFRGEVGDLLSGYRAFTRRFVKTFPAESKGFEIETELTIFANEHRLSMTEVDVAYLPRPEGSESKLSTVRDGVVISFMLLRLFRDMRPLQFFGIIAAALAVLSIILFLPILETYLETHLVPRLPTLILVAVLDLVAILLVMIGVILERTAAIRRYVQYLQYLTYPSPSSGLIRIGEKALE
ncbi:MAG: glycosyltransferase [Kiloniellales bacterium]|nr:glycosyltransferase [Kiloniellales bacterium]